MTFTSRSSEKKSIKVTPKYLFSITISLHDRRRLTHKSRYTAISYFQSNQPPNSYQEKYSVRKSRYLYKVWNVSVLILYPILLTTFLRAEISCSGQTQVDLASDTGPSIKPKSIYDCTFNEFRLDTVVFSLPNGCFIPLNRTSAPTHMCALY